MTPAYKILASAILLVVVAVLAFRAGSDASIRQALGLGDPEPAAVVTETTQPASKSTTQPASKSVADPAGAAETRLDSAYVARLLANVDRNQRQQLLDNEEFFSRFVRQEADNIALVTAARANQLHEDENFRFLMQRAADNVLREMYLNQLMLEQLPGDFPTEQQARDFYTQNADQFEIGERLQVWQVFLEYPQDADADARSATEKQARELFAAIKSGKQKLAEVAEAHSRHQPSRQNGGFMGAVRIANLKPDIANALGELEKGEIGLARTDQGWHILRKGEVIAPEQLEFEQVETQVRRFMVNRAKQQFRAA
ncbi:MAG: peptidyl-prolyl cis-trans isomerase, partial [Gammaproteobacteria bacterium]